MSMTRAPAAADLASQFAAIVGPEGVLTSPTDRMVYECDAYTIEKSSPDVVVLPRNRDEVVEVVRLCKRLGVPFIPRGAGTSLAGGTVSVGGGVLVAMTRMNKILEIHPRDRYAVVEPGVVNLWVTQALSGTGLHYAPDPSSQGACTIGGNVATNSGGPHTLKYGVTVNHVLGVEMVLPSGEIVCFGGPAEESPGYDLAGLTVGSEGTFGICTKVWIRLTPNPEGYRTLLGVFETVDDASNTIRDVIAAGIVPAALEMMDQLIILAVEEAFHFGFPLDAEAVLIMEVDGLEVGLDDAAERIAAIARANHARSLRLAADEDERQLLWKCRKKAFGAIGRLSPSYCCQDGVVPRSKIPEMLRFMRSCGEKHGVRIANVFHAGDGNMHPILLFDERDPDQLARVVAASHDILEKCIELGGSVTGEHGIGVEKIAFMDKLFSAADLEAMTRVREVFNPDGRCNPHKMLPSGGHCVEVGLPALRRAT